MKRNDIKRVIGAPDMNPDMKAKISSKIKQRLSDGNPHKTRTTLISIAELALAAVLVIFLIYQISGGMQPNKSGGQTPQASISATATPNIFDQPHRPAVQDNKWAKTMSALTEGFLMTLALALPTALIGALLGFLLLIGLRNKNNIGYWISNAYIIFFKNVPILLQLFIVYYGFPAISRALMIPGQYLPAAFVLLLNAAAALPDMVKALAIPGNLIKAKIFLLAFIGLVRKTILYSTLVSFIASIELLKVVIGIAGNHMLEAVYIALAVYLIMGIGLWLLQIKLKKAFFKDAEAENIF